MTDKYAEQIFDYFLEELVTDQRPPDLTARIQAAWKRESAGKFRAANLEGRGLPLVQAEVVEAATAADKRSVSNLARSASIQGASTARVNNRRLELNRRAARQNSSTARKVIAVLLAISACVSLVYVSWRLPLDDGDNAVAVDPDPTAEPSQSIAGNQGEHLPRLPKIDIPPVEAEPVFAIDEPALAANAAAQPAPKTPDSRLQQPVEALPDEQVVADIDQRLAGIWEELSVTPTVRLSPAERAQRISQLLTGQDRSADQLASYGAVNQLVRAETKSKGFADLWSERFTELWLSSSRLSDDDAGFKKLQQSVAKHIESDRPWNEVVMELIGGELKSQESATSTYWAALAAVEGRSNHRLVDSIGSSFLDANMACVKCHDASGGWQLSTIGQQDVYWSLIAALKGISVEKKAQSGEWSATDSQAELFAKQTPPVAFFRLSDGRMKAAEPKLPDGEDWKSVDRASSPRQALAKWISQSPMLDAATVNQVWKMAFGKLLVPRVATVEDVAIKQRMELQQFLTDQYRAHNRDLRQLVGWIARSDALARQPLRLERGQWLTASEADLAKLQLADEVFATGPAPKRSSEAVSLENSLVALMDWRGNSGSIDAATKDVLLAQPVPAVAPKRPRQGRNKVPADQAMPSLGYVVHGERHTAAELAYVNRLLDCNRLSWDQCVEHVVELGATSYVDDRIKQLANDLLQQNSGNAQAALLDLLWAVKNSDSI
jgi:hypothetical protein